MTGLVATVALVAGLALVVLLRSPEPRTIPPTAEPPTSPAEAPPRVSEVPAEATPSAPAGTAPPAGPRQEPATAPTAPTARPVPAGASAPPTAASASGKASAPEASLPVPGRGRGESGLPRVAIVLDDCGQSVDLMQRAVRLKHPLTFAVIPHLQHSTRSAEMANDAGQEVIVHQPMEPQSKDEDPGDRAIVAGMKADRVGKVLKASFDDVPHAIGLNNHMGSAATANRALMEIVVAALERVRPGAVFLDSRTTPATVAAEIARSHGLPTAERAVFLDNDLAPAAIRGELTRLMKVAAERGEAVAIGHLKAETLDVLEQEIPRLEGRECRFVFLSALVR